MSLLRIWVLDGEVRVQNVAPFRQFLLSHWFCTLEFFLALLVRTFLNDGDNCLVSVFSARSAYCDA